MLIAKDKESANANGYNSFSRRPGNSGALWDDEI